jgi:hypothetical protein
LLAHSSVRHSNSSGLNTEIKYIDVRISTSKVSHQGVQP